MQVELAGADLRRQVADDIQTHDGEDAVVIVRCPDAEPGAADFHAAVVLEVQWHEITRDEAAGIEAGELQGFGVKVDLNLPAGDWLGCGANKANPGDGDREKEKKSPPGSRPSYNSTV